MHLRLFTTAALIGRVMFHLLRAPTLCVHHSKRGMACVVNINTIELELLTRRPRLTPRATRAVLTLVCSNRPVTSRANRRMPKAHGGHLSQRPQHAGYWRSFVHSTRWEELSAKDGVEHLRRHAV